MRKTFIIVFTLILINLFSGFTVLADEPNIGLIPDKKEITIIHKDTGISEIYHPDIDYKEGDELNVYLEWKLDKQDDYYREQSFTYNLGDLQVTTKPTQEFPEPIYDNGILRGHYWIDDSNILHVDMTDDFLEKPNREIFVNLKGTLPADERINKDGSKGSFKIGEEIINPTLHYNESTVTLAKRVSGIQNAVLNYKGLYEVEYELTVTFDGYVHDVILQDNPGAGLSLPSDSSAYTFVFLPENSNHNYSIFKNGSGEIIITFDGEFYQDDQVIITYTGYVDKKTMEEMFKDNSVVVNNKADGTYTDNKGTENKPIPEASVDAKAVRPGFDKYGEWYDEDTIEWTIIFNSGSLGNLKALVDNFQSAKENLNIQDVDQLWNALGLGEIKDTLGPGLNSEEIITLTYDILVNSTEVSGPDIHGGFTYKYKYQTKVEDKSQATYTNKVESRIFGKEMSPGEGTVGVGGTDSLTKRAVRLNTEKNTIVWEIKVSIPTVAQLNSLNSFHLYDYPEIASDPGFNLTAETYQFEHRIVEDSVLIAGRPVSDFDVIVESDRGTGIYIYFDPRNAELQKHAGTELTITLESEILNGNGDKALTAFSGNVRYKNKIKSYLNDTLIIENEAYFEQRSDSLITKDVVGSWKGEDRSDAQWYVEFNEVALAGKGDRISGVLAEDPYGVNEEGLFKLVLTDTIPENMTFVDGSAYVELSTFDWMRKNDPGDLPVNAAKLNKVLSSGLSIEDLGDGKVQISWTLTNALRNEILETSLINSDNHSSTVRNGWPQTDPDDPNKFWGCDWDKAKIRIYYTTRIQDIDYEAFEDAGEEGFQFVNTVEGELNDVNCGSSQAAIYLHKQEALSKSYRDVGELLKTPGLSEEYKAYLNRYNVHKSNYHNIYFNVDINPQRLRFSKDPNGKIKLVDTLEENINLIPNSVRITDGETGIVLSLKEYTVSYDNNRNSFSIEVPEGRYFILEYFGAINPSKLDNTNPSDPEIDNIGNKVELFGFTEEYSEVSEFPDISLVPSAGANSGKTVYIYKYFTNIAGNSQALEGAHFDLDAYKLTNDSLVKVKVNSTEDNNDFPDVQWENKISDSEGNLHWEGLHQNYIYRITETQVPDDYRKLTDPIYFIFSDYENGDEVKKQEVFNYFDSINQSIEEIYSGKIIPVENELKRGNLELKKEVEGSAPSSVISNTEFTFTITGPEIVAGHSYNIKGVSSGKVTFSDYEEGVLPTATVKITGRGSMTILDLPLGTYSITEDSERAQIPGYELEITGNNSQIAVLDNQEVSTTITNEYSIDIKETGSLELSKALEPGAPDQALEKDYTFIVTGPPEVANKSYAGISFDANREGSVKVKAGTSIKITDIPIGEYTVKEDRRSAAIEGYTLSIAGEKDVSITANGTASATLINKYTEISDEPETSTGSLTVKKSIAGNILESEVESKEFRFTITGPEGIQNRTFGAYTFDENRQTTVTITGARSITIDGLPSGNYQIAEDREMAEIAFYSLVVEGKDEFSIPDIEEIEITNTYSMGPSDPKVTGLKITKNLAENAPDEAESKEYSFNIFGPTEVADQSYNGVEFDSDCKATVTIKGKGSKTITGIPAGSYTIEENRDGTDIEGYNLDVSGENTVDITADEILEVTITNTYTQETNTPTPTTGNLQVTKAFGETVPESANSKDFTFTVSGLIELVAGKTYDDVTFNEEGKATITIKGYGSKLIKGLPIGTYSVSEDKDEAIISGYYLTVTGEGNVEVTTNSEPRNITITNNYSEGPAFNEDELGSLTLNKVISGDIPEDKYKDKVFTFMVTGPKEIAGKSFAGYDFDGSGKTTVTITGQNSITITGLPTGIYRVEEFGNIAIEGYAWTVDITDEGQVAITKDSEETVTITNNYEDPSGNLTIKKKIQGNAKGTDTKVYSFTITGPSSVAGVGFELVDGSETIKFTDSETPTAQVQITGSGSATITGLPYGTYTVKENRDSAQINGYTLTVSGESSVTFDTESSNNQTVTITNSYSESSNNTPNTPGPTPQPNPNPGNTPEYKPDDIQKPDNPSTPDNNETTTAPKLTIYKEQSVQRNNQENYEQSYDGQRTTSYIEVREGDIVTYYLTVKNSGNETAQNVVITDPVPEGLIIIEDSATRKENLVISGNTLTWIIDSIPANGTVSIEVQFKIQVPEITQEIYWKNTAFVNYKDNPNGPIYSNTVTIGDPPVNSSPADTEIVTPNDVNSTDSTNTVEQAVNKSTTTTTTSVGVTSTGVSPQTGITGGISVFVLIIIAAVLVLLDQKRKDIIKQKSQGKE